MEKNLAELEELCQLTNPHHVTNRLAFGKDLEFAREIADFKNRTNEQLLGLLMDRVSGGHTVKVHPNDEALKNEILKRMAQK